MLHTPALHTLLPPPDSAYLDWLRGEAISLRTRGLAAYRAHADDEAMSLLDAADDAFRVLNTLQGNRSASA